MQPCEVGRVRVAGERCGSEGAAGKGCGGAGDRALQDHRGLHRVGAQEIPGKTVTRKGDALS